MPSYKLLYFNGRGRGETARMLFALAGVDYVDERFEPEEWPTVKPTTPFGITPILYVDGTSISQSHAIERFLARKFGYAGKTDIEQAQVDMLVDYTENLRVECLKSVFVEDAVKKAERQEEFSSEILPNMLRNFEKILLSNKGGDCFFVGDSITFADIALTNILDTMKFPRLNVTYDIKGNHPKLVALADRVLNQPKIVEWVAKRPYSVA